MEKNDSHYDDSIALMTTDIQARVLNIFIMAGSAALLLFGIVNIVIGSRLVGWFEIGIGAISMVNILLLKIHKSALITTGLMVITSYFFCLFIIFTGGLSGTGIYWLYAYPLIVFMLLPTTYAMIAISAFFASLLLLLFFQLTNPSGLIYYSYLELQQMIVSQGAIGFMMYTYRRINENSGKLLHLRTSLLEDSNEKLRQKELDHKQSLARLSESVRELADTKLATLNILEDIDEERQRSQARAEELDKFKLAVDSASDQIVITDPDGIILYANQAVKKITGYDPGKIIGTKVGTKQNWGGQMPETFYKKLWHRLKDEKKVFHGELLNKRKNGEMYYSQVTINPVLSEGKAASYFISVERDVTREKQINKMKTEFISLASHQLRTPLSAMKWFLEMLMDGDAGKLNKGQAGFVAKINTSNERMIELVNSLLNVARIESGRLLIDASKTNIKVLIEELVESLKPKLTEKQQRLILKFDKGIPDINIDTKLLRQVVMNLINNSVKYTPQKGTITIQVINKAKYLQISINDTGYGIPEAEQAKVFDKFFRASNIVTIETDGNGLGLYMAQSIVHSFKGKIWFVSKENEGTTFYITLPKRGISGKIGEVGLLAVN